jgi:glycosyltransferase involved in cell wall biosynthesis
MSRIRVLELRSVWGTGGGPDKTILSGAALKGSADIETTVCYIRDARDPVFSIDRRAQDLGIDYAEVVERHSFDRAIWPQLRFLVRQRGIHIVHAHDHKTDFLTWLLAKVEPIIPLSTAHGFAGESFREKVYYAVEKRLLARFPHVIAVSRPIRDELLRTGSRPERVTVINNAIDHRVFARTRPREAEVRREYGYASDDIVIGAVGRLESEKRFDLLIEAFAVVSRRQPGVRLAIVGEGSCRPALEAHMVRLGVTERCRLLGHQADVISMHHLFDLFVQSSIREGTPNAVLEAMALETPIVATDVGGTAELVKHDVHGLLVRAGSAAPLAAAIEAALSDRSAAAVLAAAARRRIETELSFERRMQKVESIYETLMANASAGHNHRTDAPALAQDQRR